MQFDKTQFNKIDSRFTPKKKKNYTHLSKITFINLFG